MNRILTNGGHYFKFQIPHEHFFPIHEIARALSKLCRFTGHVSRFYSVAEHSVLVSTRVPRPLKLAALLHDASEAYLGDVASPLKALLGDYKAIEKDVERAIAVTHPYAIGLFPMHPLIKKADIELLQTERLQFFDTHGLDLAWPNIEPAPIDIIGLHPEAAELLFMKRYIELMDDYHERDYA